MAKRKETAAITLDDFKAAVDRGRQRDRDRIAQQIHAGPTFAGIPIVTDESVPLGEIRLEHPDGRVDRLVNLNRECGQGAVGGCELGLGHPGDCLGRHPSDPRRYLVWERSTGRLLREI